MMNLNVQHETHQVNQFERNRLLRLNAEHSVTYRGVLPLNLNTRYVAACLGARRVHSTPTHGVRT